MILMATPNTCGPKQKLLVLATFTTMFINCGILLSMGALFDPIAEYYQTSRPATALVQSLMFGTGCTYLVVAAFIEKYGLCKVSLIGAVILPAGHLVGYFANNIIYLYVFMAIPTGVGIHTLFMCGMVALGIATEGRTKSAVLALPSAFMAVGGGVFPYLLNLLEQEYGLKGTFLILSGLSSNNIILAVLLSDVYAKPQYSSDKVTESRPNGVAWLSSRNIVQECIPRIQYHICSIFNLLYMLTFVAFVPMMSTVGAYTMLYVDLFKSNGFTKEDAFTSAVLYRICGTCCSLSTALIKRFTTVSSLGLSSALCILGCVGILLMCLSRSLPTAYTGSALLGMSDIGNFSCIAFIAAEQVSDKRYGKAYGLLLTSFYTCSIAVGPLFAAIRDTTRSYTPVLLVMCAIFIISAVLYILAMIVQRRSTLESSEAAKAGNSTERASDNPVFTLQSTDL